MNKFKDILDSIKDTPPQKLELNSHILIIDGLNTFIRNFSMINHINPNGHHIGGMTGFLKSVGYIAKLIHPSRVVIVFDGMGSSTTKKNLFPEYKSNRNVGKITNWDIFENKDEEKESMQNQILRLIEYLKLLPVTLIAIDKIEADDVIGHLATKTFANSSSVTIMSADKDFYQLINDRVCVYNPLKKYIVRKEDVLKDFGVSAKNFKLYKIILGDASDTIPGVKGIGEKKLLKLFPFLKEDSYFDLDKLLEHSKTNISEHKLYENVLLFEKQLRINDQLIDITNQPLMEDDIAEIEAVVAEPPPNLNSSKFLFMYEKDQLGNSIPRVNEWLLNNFGFLNQ